MLCALALASCVSVPDPLPIAASPAFDPVAFFAGASEGEAQFKVIFRRKVPVRVISSGHMEGDILVLDQQVYEGDKPMRMRSWRIGEIAPGRYEGTLSDAGSPMTGTVDGNRLRLTFTTKSGMPVEQLLTLEPDGRTVRNVLVVRKWGLAVAVLNETIRKTGP
ncbi:MAG: DUF3833 family protein [Blastomonas sp.]